LSQADDQIGPKSIHGVDELPAVKSNGKYGLVEPAPLTDVPQNSLRDIIGKAAIRAKAVDKNVHSGGLRTPARHYSGPKPTEEQPSPLTTAALT
jgi:hypothetical protein